MTARCDESRNDSPTLGFGRFVPPSDVLMDVFTPAIRQGWRARKSDELTHRLSILSACGPYPSDPLLAADIRYWRAKRAAWETYLFTAFACGFFEGTRGRDLRNRLRCHSQEGFLAAIAECMTCWFLAGKHGLPLIADAPGRNGRNLDMKVIVSGHDVGVEVKAPFRETPTERLWCGDDSEKIAQVMDAANKQFSDGIANVLVIAPSLRRPMYSHRRDLLKAAFGQSKITWEINPRSGDIGPTKVRFFADGRFLSTASSSGRPLKADGFPAYRRISAILCIEETMTERFPFPNPIPLINEETRSQLLPLWERACDLYNRVDNCAWIEHNVLVLHNPYAYHALSHNVFAPHPLLVPVAEQLQWTDGEAVVV
jgi:hypothetical protein